MQRFEPCTSSRTAPSVSGPASSSAPSSTAATSQTSSGALVSHITRVLGWGGGRGLANRLTDGLQITLRSGDVYFISPTDPESFAAAILAARTEGTPN